MSSVTTLMKHLRQLPFTEMMQVAEELQTAILQQAEVSIGKQMLAEILAGLHENDEAVQSSMNEDEKILRKLFTRKRTVAIQRQGAGWEIEISTLPGSNVVGTELRPMFGAMLDQIITLDALTGKK